MLGSVVLGLFVAPGHALSQGRLAGIAVADPAHPGRPLRRGDAGLMALLWLCGRVSGRVALGYVVVAGVILLLTHTRTALLAMVVGPAGRRPEPVRGQVAGAEGLPDLRLVVGGRRR